MGLKAIPLYLDDQDIAEYERLFGKRVLSRDVRDYVKTRNAQAKNDTTGVNYELIQMELDEVLKQKEEIDKEVLDLNQKKESALKLLEQEKKRALEAEKQRLEVEAKKKHCQGCQKEISEPIITKKGLFQACKDCMISFHGSQKMQEFKVEE